MRIYSISACLSMFSQLNLEDRTIDDLMMVLDLKTINMNTKEYLNKLFKDAGWYQDRSIEFVNLQNIECEVYNHAIEILRNYGDLHVGKVGIGRECSTSDINFYNRPKHDKNGICEPWEVKLGKLVAIATAHNEHT